MQYLRGCDLEFHRPRRLPQTKELDTRLVHVVRGRGKLIFPLEDSSTLELPFQSGDLLLLSPGCRRLHFSSAHTHYRFRVIKHFPHPSEPGQQILLRGHQRDLYIAALTELPQASKQRSQTLLTLLADLITNCSLPHRDQRVHDVINSIHQQPLRFQHVQQLADHCQISPTHLRRIFQQVTGENPKQYLHQQRMKYARDILQTEGLSVADVAALLNYSDPFVFSRRYRSHFGIAPSQDRNTTQSD